MEGKKSLNVSLWRMAIVKCLSCLHILVKSMLLPRIKGKTAPQELFVSLLWRNPPLSSLESNVLWTVWPLSCKCMPWGRASALIPKLQRSARATFQRWSREASAYVFLLMQCLSGMHHLLRPSCACSLTLVHASLITETESPDCRGPQVV
jgi:hypothetical protein